MTLQEIDWTELGYQLRMEADTAHEGRTPSIDTAYSFLLDNPECFGEFEEWPTDMPQVPPIELVAEYYCPRTKQTVWPAEEAPAPQPEDEYVWIRIGIRRTKNSDGWDLLCGEDKSRDVTGLQAERSMAAYCTECLDALQTIVDQAEPIEPQEPDYELASDRESGIPDHRWPA